MTPAARPIHLLSKFFGLTAQGHELYQDMQSSMSLQCPHCKGEFTEQVLADSQSSGSWSQSMRPPDRTSPHCKATGKFAASSAKSR